LNDLVAGLEQESRARLETLVGLLADPRASTTVRDPARAWDIHVADALSALELSAFEGARTIADLGSGAGFPGLVLAIALPHARVDLVESVSRRCEFIEAAIAATGLANARVICARSEDWAGSVPPRGGREAYDVVTARAVSSLAADAELASPLLRDDGALVAWKGARSAAEEADLAEASSELAMTPQEIVAVRPYHVVRKSGPTPHNLPRRAGIAAKRRGR
jgi:16S rRNA (guanine527-N7)-methyltransferase